MMFGLNICRSVIPFAFLLYMQVCYIVTAEKISDKRLCGDRSCLTLISKARSLARHKPTDPAFLPFERGTVIDIYSKSAGNRQDLWGGEVNGRKGYFPRSFVREFKVENPNPAHEVETEYHVPLEERVRGTPGRREVPQNARTVKQETRPHDTPQQPNNEQVHGRPQDTPQQSHNEQINGRPQDTPQQPDNEQIHDKKEAESRGEGETQAASETVDETELADETELVDEEQETENIEAGSSDATDQASDRETDVPKTEALDDEEPADDDKTDPTEVDETEVAEDETEPEENRNEIETPEKTEETDTRTEESKDETEIEGKRDEPENEGNVDETETDETDLEEEEEASLEKEVAGTEEDRHNDGYVDIDKVEEGASADIVGKEEEDKTLADTQGTQRDQETPKDEQGDEPAEKKEQLEDGHVKKEGETETEADETDNADKEGSMLGSIWSDGSEGKKAESEVINHVSYGEHAVNIPNPVINTGDDIDTLIKENIKTEDENLHENINDGEKKGLETGNSEMHEAGKGREIEINKDINETANEDDMYVDGTGNNNKEMNKHESAENFVTKIEHKNQDLGETKPVNEVDKTTDLPLSEDLDADKEQEFLDSVTKLENNEPHDSEQLVNDIENGNLHLKDILKSSLPEGNDVHQYIVEHAASDNPFPTSDTSDMDILSTEVNHGKVDKNNDDLLSTKEAERNIQEADKSKDGEKSEDNNNMLTNSDASLKPEEKSDNHEKMESVLSEGKEENNAGKEKEFSYNISTTDTKEMQEEENLIYTDIGRGTKDADGDEVKGSEKAKVNEEFTDSTGEHNIDEKRIDRDQIAKEMEADTDTDSSEMKGSVVIKEHMENRQNSDESLTEHQSSGTKMKEIINDKQETVSTDQEMDKDPLETHEVKDDALSPETYIRGDIIKDSGERQNDNQVMSEHSQEKQKDSGDQNDYPDTQNSENEILNENSNNHIDDNNKSVENDKEIRESNGNERKNLEGDSNDEKLAARQQVNNDTQKGKTVEVATDGTTAQTVDSDDTGIQKNVAVPQDADVEDKKSIADEDKSNFVDEIKDSTDEAVMSPFKKTDDETVDTDKLDEQNKEKSLDDKSLGTVEDSEKQSGEAYHGEKKEFDHQVNKERNKETMEVKENDEHAEKILDKFEKAIEAISNEKKDATSEKTNVDDDLKFVNDQGEVIPEQLDRGTDKPEDYQKKQFDSADSNVQEMEQNVKETNIPEDKERQGGDSTMDEGLAKEQKEMDEEEINKFEKMMSVLATPTLNEPASAEMPSSILESTRTSDVATENIDRGEGTLLTRTDAQLSGTKVMTETMSKTFAEQVPTSLPDNQMTGHTIDSAYQESVTKELLQDDTRGGGVVIDGTTFDADYLGDEMTTNNVQATEEVFSTPSVIDTISTPAGNVKPTKLFDVPVEAEQTLLPPEMQQDMYGKDHKMPIDQQIHQKHTSIPEYLQPSETMREETAVNENMPSSTVSVLGTSFDAVTPTVEETQTQPIESIGVDFKTETVSNNETVASDIVQDQVQPSLDQQAYKSDVFISRKPLSTEPASAESSAETDVHSQETTTEGKQVGQDQAEIKQEVDQNNNEVTEKTVEEDVKSQGDWSHFSNEENLDDSAKLSTTESPEQIDPYSSAEHLYSRKVPDPDLDELLKEADEPFLKVLEPYLKSLINMLPPSLQTVLEQEPLGLSPTITMLVSMISTNVLALLTCMGCLCKGKKKKPGRKDPLVVIRDLEEKLFIATKEKENIEDDLQIKNKKVTEMQDELNSQQSTTGTVETDLKTIKLHSESLKKQLSEVQEELEDYKQEVTEKSQQVVYKDSELQTYHAEVQSLTQRAQDAELALQKTSHGLGEKEEELRLGLQQIQSLSEQIQQLDTSKQQLQDEAVHWSEKVKDLTEQVEQFSSESKRMQEDLAFKENELEVLRDCFLQVKAFQGEEEMKEEAEESPDLGEKLKQMMDVSRVNASLRSVEEERDVLQNKLLIEVESRKELEDQVQLLKRKFESNQTDKMKAERQCQEAQTKLEVLSKYFKEKETELTRQLGEQEVLKNQNISRLQSSDSITQELSKENDSYRQQLEDLKTEISKAERDFRSQIAANEKKAHENWLATRAAERELKESRHECGMLRQKLTDLERKLMQGPPPGLIRPITHRAMPPPGMLNGPPPPPPERPGSRGSVHGHVTPRLRDDDYRASPIGPDRMPPPPDRRLPPGPMGPRPPPPPLDAMSPPPYAIRPPFPPDRRSPPSFDRYPPPRGPRPPYPRPPPPHLRSPPPMGSNPSEHDDSKQDPYSRAPQGSRDRGPTRHQSQV